VVEVLMSIDMMVAEIDGVSCTEKMMTKASWYSKGLGNKSVVAVVVRTVDVHHGQDLRGSCCDICDVRANEVVTLCIVKKMEANKFVLYDCSKLAKKLLIIVQCSCLKSNAQLDMPTNVKPQGEARGMRPYLLRSRSPVG